MSGLLFLLLAAVLVWWLTRNSMDRRKKPRQGVSPEQRTLFNLQVGDVVQRDLRDWIVESILEFNQSGFQWREYYLRDGEEGIWLVVVDDDRLELSWMRQVPSHEISINFPLRDRLVYEGISYRLEEKGLAQYRRFRATAIKEDRAVFMIMSLRVAVCSAWRSMCRMLRSIPVKLNCVLVSASFQSHSAFFLEMDAVFTPEFIA